MRMADPDDVTTIRRAIEALREADGGSPRLAAAAEEALGRLAVDWRAELLSPATVEAVAGELFAQDAQEPVRDARGGWSKDRLRRAARSMLDIGVDAVEQRARTTSR